MTHPSELLNMLIAKKDLSAKDTEAFLNDVAKGAITPVQIGAILTALRIKGESPDEIVGLVRAMRKHVVSVNAKGAIDIVGTGGDGSGTFNISTAGAFVIAGAGVKVAKHGNRAASSKCGSADVLEALGVNISLSKEQAEVVFNKAGIVFLLAPLFHPSMKQVGAVRKELGIRTVFNILGPFANPAGTTRQLVGVPNLKIARTMAKAALKLGYEHLLIVTSDDGMDEISISAKTRMFEICGKTLKQYVIEPAKLGFLKALKSALVGGSKEENAEIVKDILHGKKGPKRDVVVLNSAAALYVAGAVKNIKEGIKLAEDSIDSGKAAQALENLVRETNA